MSAPSPPPFRAWELPQFPCRGQGFERPRSPPRSRSLASVSPRSLGTATRCVRTTRLPFFFFLEAVKTPPWPRSRPKGEAMSRGVEAPIRGGCSAPDVMRLESSPPGFTGAWKCLGLLRSLLEKSRCHLGGYLPLRAGAPVIESAPGGSWAPPKRGTVHSIRGLLVLGS